MFKLTLFICCVLAIQAQPAHHTPYHDQHAYRHADEAPKPYEFAYDTELDGGRMGRKETGDSSGRVVGSYSLAEDDGRSRVVEYVADAEGFRASVKTNEPGTKSENPADVAFYSSAPDIPHAHIVRTPTHHAAPHHPVAHAATPQRFYARHPAYYGRWYY
ncbi:cuticle protein 10.9-like [Centruroides vittatus]|uniref:cuticle protein 10.9-like n=1 Tax=Centruroides vittatus TaxID=120091 RepID=UPI00350E98DB